jgi:hypothetical protein
MSNHAIASSVKAARLHRIWSYDEFCKKVISGEALGWLGVGKVTYEELRRWIDETETA